MAQNDENHSKIQNREFWMIQIFPGKTAVYVSCPYGKEHSCKKSEKSLARFFRKSVHGLTNRRRTTLGIPTLTSTDVENSSSFWAYILRMRPLIDMRFSREVR